MVKKAFLISTFILCLLGLNAQSSITTANFKTVINKLSLQNDSNILLIQNINKSFSVQDVTKPVTIVLQPTEIVLNNTSPFITFSLRVTENVGVKNNTSIAIRFGKTINSFGNFKPIHAYAHNTDSSLYHTSELLYVDSDMKYFQLKIITNKTLTNNIFNTIQTNVFSPGHTPTNTIAEGTNVLPNNSTLSCNCAIPNYVTRTQWGHPQGQTLPASVATDVTHLIIHHADGNNKSSDWAATVRAIRDFHVNTNGWADVGYNFLIAPDGTLYEGRRSNNQDVIGAHFCSFNIGTMGVCMLGSYTHVNITNTAKSTLVKTLAWKSCDKNIDPNSTAFHANSNLILNNISGHRDGCATSCPGNTFYPSLPNIRLQVSSFINNGCNLTNLGSVDGLQTCTINPNPLINGNFDLIIKLTTPKKFGYKILNAAGKTIFSATTKTIAGTFTEKLIQLQKKPAGIYYIELSFNHQIIGKTVIK